LLPLALSRPSEAVAEADRLLAGRPSAWDASVAYQTRGIVLRDNGDIAAGIAELRRLGYVEGDNLIIERFSPEGHHERYDAMAREIVSRNPELIVTGTNPVVTAFRAATTTIPIVATASMTGRSARPKMIATLPRSCWQKRRTLLLFPKSRRKG